MDWGCNDYVSRADVLEITAETGALETQGRVKELPAADVRTVVCCRDCVHGASYHESVVCRQPTGKAELYPKDFYCPYGESVMTASKT